MFVALGALFAVSAAGFAWMLRTRSRGPVGGKDAASVSRELTRLDPFSFFVLPGDVYGVDQVVVGTTGAFAIRVGQCSVDGKIGKDVALARRGAARIRRGAGQAAVHARVQPMVCLPGRQFAPKTTRGVRVIPWGRVVAEIADRRRSVSPNQARRFAESLGALSSRVREPV